MSTGQFYNNDAEVMNEDNTRNTSSLREAHDESHFIISNYSEE